MGSRLRRVHGLCLSGSIIDPGHKNITVAYTGASLVLEYRLKPDMRHQEACLGMNGCGLNRGYARYWPHDRSPVTPQNTMCAHNAEQHEYFKYSNCGVCGTHGVLGAWLIGGAWCSNSSSFWATCWISTNMAQIDDSS